MGKWNTELPDKEQKRLSELLGREVKYLCPEKIVYYSRRYKKTKTILKGRPSDGATNAPDLDTIAWWVHDGFCEDGVWDDGSLCTNWEASAVLRDILWEDGFWFRANRWFVATWLFGGGEARKNGMF